MKPAPNLLTSCWRPTLLTTALATTMVAGPVQAALESAPTIDVPYVESIAVVDGHLDDKIWESANVVTLDYETHPAENVPAKVKTEVLLAENGDTLFVAFKAQDPNPESIRAYLRGRDSAYNDDFVGIMLDTYNSERQSYEFFVNPLGVQMDLIQNDLTGREDDSWDAIWDSAGTITDDGYQVEMAIPFNILNFEEGKGIQEWGVEMLRMHPRESRSRYSYVPLDRNKSCHLCQVGTIRGMEKAKQGKNFSITPSLTSGVSNSRDISVAADPWVEEDNTEAGLDAKWGITPDINMNATINPDFSQVEADVAQLDVNNTFALFFPEKRAFFMDNADYVTPGYDLLYTRNIAAPEYGVKLTGKQDKASFGVLSALDSETNILIPGNLGSSIYTLDEQNQSSAARIRYDYNNKVAIGTFGTFRKGDDYSNDMVGVDASIRLTGQDKIDVVYSRSSTDYSQALLQLVQEDYCDDDGNGNFSNCGGETFNRIADGLNQADQGIEGDALLVQYRHRSRNWFLYSDGEQISRNFRADLGFVGNVDSEKYVLGGGRVWHGTEDTWYERSEISGDYDITTNSNGDKIEEEGEIRIMANGPMQSFGIMGYVMRERVADRFDDSILDIDGNSKLFNETVLWAFVEAKPMSGLSLALDISGGEWIDFANDQLGDGFRLNPRVFWNLNRNLELQVRHTYNTMDVPGGRLYTANLTDARATYQFNVRSALRFSVIYSDIERDPNLYQDDDPDKNSKSIGTQLLYTYKINPATVAFFGYSDNWRNDLSAEDNNGNLDPVRNPEQDSWNVFMKLSYAFQQ